MAKEGGLKLTPGLSRPSEVGISMNIPLWFENRRPHVCRVDFLEHEMRIRQGSRVSVLIWHAVEPMRKDNSQGGMIRAEIADNGLLDIAE